MDWRKNGVKIVHADELDMNTPQTSGMTRAAAITHATAGATKLWAGTMLVQPDAKTGPHHHRQQELIGKSKALEASLEGFLKFRKQTSLGCIVFLVFFQEVNRQCGYKCARQNI